ncbi:MAG TPA: cupin domain-containing protein [Vicinamibacterales bacterium]|nr:cupin domain-containing protein [Vicinamibacterales bacterium]
MADSTIALGRLTFDELVAPITPKEFFGRHWTRQAIHLPQPGRRFESYFGWEAVEAILNAGDIRFPKIKVSRRDRPVPPDEFTHESAGQKIVDGRAVLDLFNQGASFGITGADSHWPPLRAVVDALFDALLEHVHTNVYCSPAGTQGFQCHFDLHEVFVLQVSGEKHWRMFRPTTDAPLEGWRAEDSPHTSQEPYLDVVLRPGDVLYVPRGHWHYAVATELTSLHVTVGVTCRKGSEFLDWLGGELLHEAIWRQNLPLLADCTQRGTLQEPAGLAKWADAIRESIEAKLADADVFSRFCRDTLAQIAPSHNAVFLDPALPLARMRFTRPAGRRHYFVAGQDGALTVSIAGSEIEIDGSDRDLVALILDADTFTLDDVRAWKPDASLSDVHDLVKALVDGGLLNAAPA